MDYESREAAIRFPLARADNDKGTGNQRIAVTGAAQTYALRPNQQGKYCRFQPVGVAIQAAAALSAQVLISNQVSNAAAGASSAAAGVTIADGAFIDGILPEGATHLCWLGASAVGFVEFWISEIPSGL